MMIEDILDSIKVFNRIKNGHFVKGIEFLVNNMDSSPASELIEKIQELDDKFEFIIRC